MMRGRANAAARALVVRRLGARKPRVERWDMAVWAEVAEERGRGSSERRLEEWETWTSTSVPDWDSRASRRPLGGGGPRALRAAIAAMMWPEERRLWRRRWPWRVTEGGGGGGGGCRGGAMGAGGC